MLGMLIVSEYMLLKLTSDESLSKASLLFIADKLSL